MLDESAALVVRLVDSPALRDLLMIAVESLRAQAASVTQVPFVSLPLSTYAGVLGDPLPALPLAAATSLLFAGIDLVDNIQDDELPACWRGRRGAEIHMAAATLVSALPQLAVAHLPVPPAVRDRMQYTLAAGLLRMAAGQQRDLANTGSAEVSVAEVEASVTGKSGEEAALFCALAAEMAGASPELVATYAAFGRAFGTAGQLATDCYDLFQASEGHDLQNGTRSLPIAWRLERLSGRERDDFVALLEAARTDPRAGHDVRRRLRETGALRACAFVVEVHCQRARRLLEQAAPTAAADVQLRALVDEASFFARVEAKAA